MVEEITLNHTKVTNKSGEVVYIPNKIIYSETVENLSRRRFYSYEFIVPFSKSDSVTSVENALKIIEGKINTYYPLNIEYETQNTNASDYTYTIRVTLPDENIRFEHDMRMFLIKYIF